MARHVRAKGEGERAACMATHTRAKEGQRGEGSLYSWRWEERGRDGLTCLPCELQPEMRASSPGGWASWPPDSTASLLSCNHQVHVSGKEHYSLSQLFESTARYPDNENRHRQCDQRRNSSLARSAPGWQVKAGKGTCALHRDLKREVVDSQACAGQQAVGHQGLW